MAAAADSVLQNVDILHEIFTCLTCQPSDDSLFELSNFENVQTLTNAAMVCKTFSSPALDALWWKLDNIAHLFKHLSPIRYVNQSYVRIFRRLSINRFR